MSDMVEKVARVIDPWAFSEPYGPGKALAQDQAMATARAAIEAMRAGVPDSHSSSSAWGAPSAEILTRKLW